MSLAQHVSSIEGADRQEPEDNDLGDYQPSRAVRRILSYDVIAVPPSVEVHADHVAAYKVSAAKRLAQVAITVLSCWLASGIVFGFAALKPILISEGVYRELCSDEDIDDGINACDEQNLRLNLFFTVASITANISALPVGSILDWYGPRVCGVAGSVFLAAGSLLMAYAFLIPEFDGYMIGNIFLALGGTFVFVPSFQIANAFPRYSATIVAVITGSFDASAAIFLFYRLAYEATSGRFGPDKFFFYYTLVPLLLFLAQITILPGHSYHTVPQLEKKMEKAQDPARDVHESDDELESDGERRQVRWKRKSHRQAKLRRLSELLGDEDERQHKVDLEEERQIVSGVWGALHGLPAHKQMMSPWFILITLLTVVQMLRMNYFIASIRSQYEYMLGSESRAMDVNDFFDIALPVGGVICTPFLGLLLDNSSVPQTLAFIVTLTTIIGVLNSLPFLWAAYLTVGLFVVLRPLYYSAMSDYAVKVFGFATFGRVYGTIICLSGLVNFSQYGLDALTLGTFRGNPIPINIILAGVGFLNGSALVMFVLREERALKGTEFRDEAETERQRLIPG